MSQKLWEDAVIRAAAEASRLQPLAWGLATAGFLLIVGQNIAAPAVELATGETTLADGIDYVAQNIVEAGPAFALVWALWETSAYLGRLARGEVWAPATMMLLGRVGEAMIAAALLAIFIGPTVLTWTHGDAGFDWRPEPLYIALAGLGLVLALIARVVRNVVEVAANLKAENDQIV